LICLACALARFRLKVNASESDVGLAPNEC